MIRSIVLVSLSLLLTACVARAAYDVVTLPVRAGAKVVDWTTTSQSEADRNAGRKLRKDQARQDREAREEQKAAAQAQPQQPQQPQQQTAQPAQPVLF